MASIIERGVNHYLRYCESSGCRPGQLSAVTSYLRRHPDIAKLAWTLIIRDLRHSALRSALEPIRRRSNTVVGVRQIIERSEFFDEEWYFERYPDARHMGLGAAEHYLTIGSWMRRDPGPRFSTTFYLVEHSDVADAKVNPLWHYETRGKLEGRSIRPSGYNLPAPQPENPVLRGGAPLPCRPPARVVAFYLPQFHSIPENDAWWGEGFTEWTNVRPARAQMARHHQPQVPGELGYYDLRDPAVQAQQIRIAREYGVGAFCFYFYWFAGRRLLETPIRNYFEDHSLDFPFMLCWANENWSRRWDGRNDDILMRQQHSPEDDVAFIEYVAEYFGDPRYFRISGRPVLLVYRPSLLPDPAATAERWRRRCREMGVGEIYLSYTQSFESTDPRHYGFDAAIEFPPNNSGVPDITQHVPTYPDFAGRVYDLSALAERSDAYTDPAYPLFRGICPAWDNTARRKNQGAIMINNTPGTFARWSANAVRDTVSRFSEETERLVFVNAWNEWAEGAHLEPDTVYGYAWLDALRIGLASAIEPTCLDLPDLMAGLVVDARFSCGSLAEVLEQLEKLPFQCRVFVATSSHGEGTVRSLLESADRESEILQVPQVGADWSPLHTALSNMEESFELVAYVPLSSGPTPTAEMVQDALAELRADDSLGVVLLPDGGGRPLERAEQTVVTISERLGLIAEETESVKVRSGQSFLARRSALTPLACMAVDAAQLDPVSDRYAGGFAEALDASAPLSAAAAGLATRGLGQQSDQKSRAVVIVTHDAHPHGAQRLALHLARGYSQLGFDVHVVALGGGRLLERFGEVATVHLAERYSPARLLQLARSLRVRGARFGIANTTVSGWVVPLLKRAGLPVVSLVHELPNVLAQYDLAEAARSLADHSDTVVFPAGLVRQGFESFLGGLVPSGVIRPQGLYLNNPHRSQEEICEQRRAIRRQLGLSFDASIVLGVGFADHRKGIDLFVDAGMRILAEKPGATLVWVGNEGDHELLSHARGRLRAAGLLDRFILTGLVENPEDYYTAADVFLLASREDPFPSVVMEAMDARLPVIAFQEVTGAEELLRRGAGEVVPALDTQAMAAAAVDLLEAPERARKLGAAARDIVAAEFKFMDYLYELAQYADCPIPKVSVIVPNFNYAKHIRARLDSILDQTFPVYELIVLDDASTDDSVLAINDHLAARQQEATVVVNDQNSGSVFSQWRLGVEMARGELVWIAEADDLADPEFLAEAAKPFSDPAVVLSFTQSRQISASGAVLCDHYLDYVADVDVQRWRSSYVSEGHEEIAKALFLKNTIPNVSGALFRRSALQRVLIDHANEIGEYRHAADWITYIRLLEHGKVAFSPHSLNHHRRHSDSVTIAGFDLRQLVEIVRIQTDTITRFGLGADHLSRADEYVERLYRQFGISNREHPTAASHPALARERWQHPPSQ